MLLRKSFRQRDFRDEKVLLPERKLHLDPVQPISVQKAIQCSGWYRNLNRKENFVVSNSLGFSHCYGSASCPRRLFLQVLARAS